MSHLRDIFLWKLLGKWEKRNAENIHDQLFMSEKADDAGVVGLHNYKRLGKFRNKNLLRLLWFIQNA